jgi:hypothetical protein
LLSVTDKFQKYYFYIQIQAIALDPGDWITLISNEKQVSHHNGKKSIFSINTTLSEFLKDRSTREIYRERKRIQGKSRERKENIFYINLSFLKAYIFISFKILD